ncbi:MAG: polysaccharide biosynthesis/export family protein [Rubricella sp.]
MIAKAPMTARTLLAFFAILILPACTLPRAGPTLSEITAQPDDGSPAVEIIAVDDRVASLTRLEEPLFFSPGFLDQQIENIELIRPLDVLSITIWENGPTPLFGGIGGPTPIGEKRVDLSGRIFIPQVGRIRAAGLTIEQFRRDLTARLAPATPDPQVEVTLVVSDNNTVRVFSDAGPVGEYPIEARTRTLSGLLANSGITGGVSAETAQIIIRRGAETGRVWMEDVYRDPRADIALRGGDIVIIERDRRAFRALGALGGNSNVPFPGRDISLMTALAQLGGLNPATADPRGVFILREEVPEVLARIGEPAAAPRRVAYVMDLTQPAAFFTASNFYVRDEDVLYVTEAPYVQWLKILGSIAPPIQQINATNQLLQDVTP